MVAQAQLCVQGVNIDFSNQIWDFHRVSTDLAHAGTSYMEPFDVIFLQFKTSPHLLQSLRSSRNVSASKCFHLHEGD